MHRTISSKIGVAIILLLTVGAVYVVRIIPNNTNNAVKKQPLGYSPDQEKIDENKQAPIEEKTVVSTEWKTLSAEDFPPSYKFPAVKIYYPSNWHYNGPTDIDGLSAHVIGSTSSFNPSKPFIRILDYVLMGCPSVKDSCSIDETIVKSPKQKYDELIKHLPSNAKIMEPIKLKGLNKYAYTYTLQDSEKSETVHLINLGEDVISISFGNFDKINDRQLEFKLLDMVSR